MKKLLSIIFVLTLNFAFSSEHSHKKSSNEHSHTSSSSEIKDLGANKFIPTDDLKVRMDKVLTLVKKVQKNKKNLSEVKQIGTAISSVISDIFKTCKLEAAADDAIHPVLAGILQGSSAFEKGDYKTGISKLHTSLMDYEKLFLHKGWKH